MATQRYSVTPRPIETLLTCVKSGKIAIPEIQRPFEWDATNVRSSMSEGSQVRTYDPSASVVFLKTNDASVVCRRWRRDFRCG